MSYAQVEKMAHELKEATADFSKKEKKRIYDLLYDIKEPRKTTLWNKYLKIVRKEMESEVEPKVKVHQKDVALRAKLTYQEYKRKHEERESEEEEV